MNTQVFRKLLQEELIRRTNANPRFSVRAFARQLEVEPSSLSQILRGTRPLTSKMCLRLLHRLNLSPEQLNILNSPEGTSRRKVVDMDVFKIMSDWYHFAILELTRTKHFQPHPEWVAETLGITVDEVDQAVGRMCEIGFLEITKEGEWIDQLGQADAYNNELTHAALKIMQKQILAKAASILDEDVPVEERAQYSMTMAIDTSKVPMARQKIKGFIRELEQELQNSEDLQEVYLMSASIYPVSKNRKLNENIKENNDENEVN